VDWTYMVPDTDHWWSVVNIIVDRELFFLGYNAVWSVECQHMIRTNMAPQTSWLKQKNSFKMQQTNLVSCLIYILYISRRLHISPNRCLAYNGLKDAICENLKSYMVMELRFP
jgi:hypothetical protein